MIQPEDRDMKFGIEDRLVTYYNVIESFSKDIKVIL